VPPRGWQRADAHRLTCVQGSKQRLRIRVVVADVRSAKRRDDPQPLEGSDHRVPPHRLPVIRVRHQPVRIDPAFGTDAVNQRGRSLGELVVVDLPAHNAPAPHVHYQVETKKPSASHGRQIRDAPAPDLVRSRVMDSGRRATCVRSSGGRRVLNPTRRRSRYMVDSDARYCPASASRGTNCWARDGRTLHSSAR